MASHSGFTNNSELKRRLKTIIYNLNKLAENKTSHLSDIAINIGFIQKDLINLTADIFTAHEKEKKFTKI